MGNILMTTFLFHENVSSAGTGNELTIKQNYDNLTLEVLGNPASISFQVEGRANTNGDFKPIQVVELTEMDVTSNLTKVDGIYSVDLTGFSSVRVRINSVAGTCTIKGRVVK